LGVLLSYSKNYAVINNNAFYDVTQNLISLIVSHFESTQIYPKNTKQKVFVFIIM